MKTYFFLLNDRKKNSNEPVSYTIFDVASDAKPAGTLTRSKKNWKLSWLGLRFTFATKNELNRHFSLLGHKTEWSDAS